jgi:hypothetical protein
VFREIETVQLECMGIKVIRSILFNSPDIDEDLIQLVEQYRFSIDQGNND